MNLTHHETLVRKLCTVCGSSDVRLFLRESTAEVCKCSACGHVFTRAIYRDQAAWKEELKASGGWNVKETDNPRDPFYRWVLDSVDSVARQDGEGAHKCGPLRAQCNFAVTSATSRF